MKRFFLLFLFSSIVLSLPAGFKRLTSGFKLAKMRLEIPFDPGWEVVPPQEKLEPILNQPFTYLDKGAQCYVFQSRDGRYVIKLFRYDQPHFFKKKKRGSLERKVAKLFAACALAYNQAKEETGLVYIHLNLTEKNLPTICAKGPLGQRFFFPLDRYRFAIQKKVDPFRKTLLDAYTSNEGDAFPKLIDSFVSTLTSRVKKGIGNSDPTLSRNFGFLEGRAVEIDFGNYFSQPNGGNQEVRRYTNRLRRWMQHNAPEWIEYLDTKVDQCENELSW